MTLISTLAVIFDEICSLCKWKLELMKVMRCLNRSWIHYSYHPLTAWITDQLWGEKVWGEVRIPSFWCTVRYAPCRPSIAKCFHIRGGQTTQATGATTALVSSGSTIYRPATNAFPVRVTPCCASTASWMTRNCSLALSSFMQTLSLVVALSYQRNLVLRLWTYTCHLSASGWPESTGWFHRCATVHGHPTGDSFSLLCIVWLTDIPHSFVMTFNII